MGILLGLMSAVSWGVGDLFARFATNKIGNFRSYLYMQLVGLAGLTIFLLIQFPTKWDWFYVALAAGLAVTNSMAGLALYRAFETGLLSVVSPIAASYGAISLGLGLLSGQSITLSELSGLVLTIIGVALASTRLGVKPPVVGDKPASRTRLSSGVGFALLAAVLFGVTFWGLGYVAPQVGGVLPVWVSRVVAPVVVLTLSIPFRQSLKPPTRSAWPWIIGVGVLDSAAYIFYNMGLQSAQSGIVAVISSLFSAVTVVLAWVFLRERLALNQWLGIALIFMGVGLVSARF